MHTILHENSNFAVEYFNLIRIMFCQQRFLLTFLKKIFFQKNAFDIHGVTMCTNSIQWQL